MALKSAKCSVGPGSSAAAVTIYSISQYHEEIYIFFRKKVYNISTEGGSSVKNHIYNSLKIFKI